jgi:hypothetical protein
MRGRQCSGTFCDSSVSGGLANALPDLLGPQPPSQTDNCDDHTSTNKDYETAQVRNAPAPKDPVQYFNIDTSGGAPDVQVWDGMFIDTNFRCDKTAFTDWLALTAALHGADPSNGSRRFSSQPGEYCTGDQDVRWDINAIPGNHLLPADPNNVHCPDAVNKDFWLPYMAQCQYDDAVTNNNVAVRTTFELMQPNLTVNEPTDNTTPVVGCAPKHFPGYADIATASRPPITWPPGHQACSMFSRLVF